MDWLQEYTARIPVDADSVKVLTSPDKFFDHLKLLIGQSRQRIVLSALYLGVDQYEQDLVDCLAEALHNNPNVQVKVLLDCTRGLRGGDKSSSKSMLKSLVSNYGYEATDETKKRMSVHFFHTPALRGLLKRLLPDKYNETIGLQHMKLFIFDNSLLISGANLSEQYFLNRQDRYILIEDCPALADFYAQIVHAVARCSFEMHPDGWLVTHPDCDEHPFRGDYDRYCAMLRERVVEVIERFRCKDQANVLRNQTGNTVIYPLVQMGFAGLHMEDQVLSRLFSENKERMDIWLASGYFNLTDDYRDLILNKSAFTMDILSASPKANGFFGGRGLSKYIPSLYTHVANLFYDQTVRTDKTDKVRLFEYERPRWTYHAKGLWLEWIDEYKNRQLTATLVGSTNFGYRSQYRDVEAQLFLVTSDENLKRRLREERSALFDYGHRLDQAAFRRPDHFVPFWVKFLSRFIRKFF